MTGAPIALVIGATAGLGRAVAGAPADLASPNQVRELADRITADSRLAVNNLAPALLTRRLIPPL